VAVVAYGLLPSAPNDIKNPQTEPTDKSPGQYQPLAFQELKESKSDNKVDKAPTKGNTA
jgi:hypothetical protein